MRRLLSIILIMLSISALFTITAWAEEKELVYDTYIYGNGSGTGNGDPITIPATFSFEKTMSGYQFGIGSFLDISDIFCDGNMFYLCDSGNRRIVVFNTDLELKCVISDFQNGDNSDSFNKPTGVFSDGENLVVCDSGNGRILVFSIPDFSLKSEFGNPGINLSGNTLDEFVYTPIKAVMDQAGRFYVIAANINQGIIRLDENGKFISFIGAPSVVPNVTELLWRKFATKAQKSRLQQYVPTEYVSLLIDDDGFLYATSKTSVSNALVRLNSKGTNILPSIDYFGDSSQSTYDNRISPYFADVAVDEDETCYVLDSDQGKIYAYDVDGQLLYAFGTNSLQKGAFYSAGAIEYYQNQLFVTDQNKSTVTVFKMTEFGKKIKQANLLYRQGKNDEARKEFMDVRTVCSDYLPAIVAISDIDLQAGKTNDALSQMKQIHDRQNYSKLFEKVRNKFIREKFIWIIAGIAVLILAVWGVTVIAGKNARIVAITQSDLACKCRYSKYTMFHPFDGFWDLKHEGKGSFPASLVILGAFVLCYGIRAQFSGYIVTGKVSGEINVFYECGMILLPICFWIIANWCFTTLMDGKGTLKDIFVYTCYSLRPYIIFSIPLFLLSHFLTVEEVIFYNVLNTVAIGWTLGLLFFGMITIHDYSLSKGILAAVLSVVGICLIIFILLLLISVTQNILEFFFNLYKEISLRAYL